MRWRASRRGALQILNEKAVPEREIGCPAMQEQWNADESQNPILAITAAPTADPHAELGCGEHLESNRGCLHGVASALFLQAGAGLVAGILWLLWILA